MPKPKGGAAFPPSLDNLGGAHMILADYTSFHNRVAGTGPTKEFVSTIKKGPSVGARKLSHHRALKQASLDSSVDHISNIYHLNRRIQEMYGVRGGPLPRRSKNTWDASGVAPVTQARPHHKDSLKQQFTQPWREGEGYNTLRPDVRPGTAPASCHMKWRVGDHYQGWSVTNNLRDTFWGDDFPVTRYQKRTNLNASVIDKSLYKQSIMDEIVSQRLYKQNDLRHVFKTYLKRAPLHDKQVVEDVVAELKLELLVD